VPRPLRIGVQLPEVEREVRWPEYAAIAAAAEQVGFDSIWVGDHLLYRGDDRPERGPWDAWAVLAALAASTRRVHLGPLVACTGFHPPGLIARMTAAIDEISGGRFVLGLGCGWNEAEFNAFGIPYDHRVARFQEAFTIIRTLVAGDRATLDGRYWKTEEAVLLPPAARRPPLVIGSNGPRMLGIALPHVDGWNTWWDGYGNTVAGFAKLNATIDESARKAGRSEREIERSACVLVSVDGRAGERRPLPDLAPVAGDPDALARHLHGLAEAGADEAILVLDPITEDSVRALEPALRLLDSRAAGSPRSLPG
jgi:alkanesulfonate monooxygenase SsuD/methylene tetrahydromethanopterin reductase-like flavin-dependent oxidoreductase (luciferase family)